MRQDSEGAVAVVPHSVIQIVRQKQIAAMPAETCAE